MPLTYPYTLTNGTNADASQVQGNFDAVKLSLEATYVTSLPGSPFDGQEVVYAASATDGVMWHLRYRSASASSYKWEMVGGGALRSFSEGPAVVTSGVLFGVTVTTPLAGDYEVTYGSALPSGGPLRVQLAVNGVAHTGVNTGLFFGTEAATHSTVKPVTIAGAGGALRIIANNFGGAASVSLYDASIFARPVRVG